MKFSQMKKPRQTLDPEDLNAYSPGGAVVTVEAFSYKTLEAKRPGDAEIAYYLKVREFAKLFKLNDTSISALKELFGTDDTETAIGRTFKLIPTKIWINDQATRKRVQIWTFDIDMIAPALPPTIAMNTDITRFAAQVGGAFARPPAPAHAPQLAAAGISLGIEVSTLGIDLAAKVVASLMERGQTVETFVNYMASIGGGQMVEGKIPPDWTKTALALARAFLIQFPKSRAPLGDVELDRLKNSWRPPVEVINPATGEVVGSPPISPDDIPF